MNAYKGLSTEVHGHPGYVAPEQVHAVANPYVTREDKALVAEYLEEEDPARPTVY